MKVVHLGPAMTTGKISGDRITDNRLSPPNFPDIVAKVTPTAQKPTVPSDNATANLRIDSPRNLIQDLEEE